MYCLGAQTSSPLSEQEYTVHCWEFAFFSAILNTSLTCTQAASSRGQDFGVALQVELDRWANARLHKHQKLEVLGHKYQTVEVVLRGALIRVLRY